jgi:hypothetical protein
MDADPEDDVNAGCGVVWQAPGEGAANSAMRSNEQPLSTLWAGREVPYRLSDACLG